MPSLELGSAILLALVGLGFAAVPAVVIALVVLEHRRKARALSLWAKLGIAGLGVLVLPGLALVVIAQVLR